MKRIAGILFILCTLFMLSSCSPTKETIKDDSAEKKDSMYVFDEVNTEPELTGTYYIVQIGAFTTEDKAQVFADQFKAKMNKEVSISYSKGINLYVVQLLPKFKDKPEAEGVRDLIKKEKEFSDVWILTVNK